MRRHLWGPLLLAALGATCLPAPGLPEVADADCGVESLASLCWLLGRPVERDQVRAVMEPGPQGVSLLAVRNAASRLGVGLSGMWLSIAELRLRGLPALLHLRNPDHFMALAGLGSRHAIVYDQGGLQVEETDTLARRFGGAVLVSSASPTESARVSVDDPVHIVEFTSPTETKTEQFRILNRGPNRVRLSIASVSCSCSDPLLLPTALASGESAILSVRVRPVGWGTVVQSMVVGTDDLLCPRIVLALQLRMPQTARPYPERITIRALEGAGASRPLTLFLGPGVSLARWGGRNRWVSVTSKGAESVVGGVAHRLEVALSASTPCGAVTDEISFALTGASVPQVSVPIDAYVVSDVGARPHEAFFGVVAPRSKTRRSVAIESAGRNAFALKSVAATDGQVRPTADCGKRAARHEVTVEVEARGEPGATIRDKVKVTLTDGRVIEFGVFAMIAEVAQEQAKP